MPLCIATTSFCEDDMRAMGIATAKNAILSGADYVVIGRTIRDSKDPVALIRSLQQEIAEGLAGRNCL